MPDPSDEELLRRFTAGDQSAFTHLVDRHADLVYRTCMRLLHHSSAAAEDAAQVVFLVAARKAAHLDGRGGLGPWFYRTAVMVARNARRGELRRSRRESREAPIMTIEEDPETHWNDAKPLLDEAIQTLGRKQREAVVLHFLQGVSQAETGRQLGCSESAVRQRLDGALAHLRRYLSIRRVEITSAGLVAHLGRDLAITCPQAMRMHCVLAQGGVHALPAASAKALAAQVLSPLASMVAVGAASVLATCLLSAGVWWGMRAPTPPVALPMAAAIPTALAPPITSIPPQFALPISAISGMVIDSTTEQPIGGVDVTVRQERWAHLPALPGARTAFGEPVATSDAHGRYTVQFLVTVPDLQEVAVTPASEDYSFSSLSTRVYRGESIEVEPMRLTPCVAVRGRITDDQGHPIAQAVLNGGSSRSLISDTDGIFTDPHAILANHFYDVAAPGYRQARIMLSEPASGRPMASFVLVPGPTISGKVDLPPGVSGEGLEVAAGYASSVNVLPVWRTPVDRQGGFTMRTAPRIGAEWWLFAVRGSQMAGRAIPIMPGMDPVLLPVYQTGTIRCEVRDASGAKVVGAKITSRGKAPELANLSDTLRTEVTDEQGMATLSWVPVGTVRLQVDWIDSQSSARVLMPHVDLELHAGETVTLAHPLMIQPAAAEGPCVQGVLHDAHGRPALHVLVGAVLMRSDQQREKLYRGQTYTQDDGRFLIEMPYDSGERDLSRRFEPPPPAHVDQVRVVANLDGYNQTILDATHAYPQGAEQQDLGVITLDLPRPRTITVTARRVGGGVPVVTIDRCIDGAGHDVPMHRLEGYWSKLQDPVRRLDILQDSMVTLQAHDDLGNQVEIAIPAGEHAVEVGVTFPLARRFHAIVRDEFDHPATSLNWFGHSLTAPWCIPPNTGSGIWCDAQGIIDQELAVQAEGTYLFFLDIAHEVVLGSVSPGSTPINREVRFARALGHLHGHIRDADGHPVPLANASVALTQDHGLGIQVSLALDGEGAFDTLLPSGITATVNASYLGGMDSQQGSSKPQEVKPGISTEIEVVLHRVFAGTVPAPALAVPPPSPVPVPARPQPKDF